MGLTPSASQNFATCVAFIILTAMAVIARFVTRVTLGQRPTIPDWLSLLSLAFFYAYCIVIINYIFNVSLFLAFDANPLLGLSELKNLLLTSFILEILFSLVITSVKISILWLYHTLFGISNLAKKLIYGTGVLCIIWFIIAILVLIVFQCRPVDAYWNEFMSPAKCWDAKRLLLGYELTNFFIDIIILCIPVVVIGKLQLSREKKVGASITFLLGIFVCISSIVRITTIFDASNPDRPVQFSASIVWSTIQGGLAIVCSCLPTFGPLFGNIAKPFIQLTSRFTYASRGSKATASAGATGDSHRRGFRGLNTPEADDTWAKIGSPDGRPSHTWNSGFRDSDEHSLQPLPPRAIMVNKQVDVV